MINVWTLALSKAKREQTYRSQADLGDLFEEHLNKLGCRLCPRAIRFLFLVGDYPVGLRKGYADAITKLEKEEVKETNKKGNK
jgi:hypothetical protein